MRTTADNNLITNRRDVFVVTGIPVFLLVNPYGDTRIVKHAGV